jgi:hypothetical protein
VTYGDMRIFDQWKLTNEPVVLIGMDAIGLLDTVIIDYRRQELQIRMRGYQTVLPGASLQLSEMTHMRRSRARAPGAIPSPTRAQGAMIAPLKYGSPSRPLTTKVAAGWVRGEGRGHSTRGLPNGTSP